MPASFFTVVLMVVTLVALVTLTVLAALTPCNCTSADDTTGCATGTDGFIGALAAAAPTAGFGTFTSISCPGLKPGGTFTEMFSPESVFIWNWAPDLRPGGTGTL